MSENTRTCQCGISTPQIAINSSQVISGLQNRTQWNYVSTLQATVPNYVYKYKSQTERIQSLIGRLSQGPCG
jgi:hypothetical protein